MPFHNEPLDRGLHTASTIARLGPGELPQCDNAYYAPYSNDLTKAPSNVTYASGLGGQVTGLNYCPFSFVTFNVTTTNASTDVTINTGTFGGFSANAPLTSDAFPSGTTVVSFGNTTARMSANALSTNAGAVITIQADHALVAQVGSNFQRSAVTNTTSGTFATLESCAPGATMSAIAMNNMNVLVNGAQDNRVLLANGVARAHGLKPVTTTFKPTVSTSGGAWANPTGFYSYWTTEYDRANDVESAFAGTPKAVQVSGTAYYVTVTVPQRLNPSATHFRVYRSTLYTSSTQEGADLEVVFPSGVRIGEGAFDANGSSVTFNDGQNAINGSALGATTRTTTAVAKLTDPTKTISWQNLANVTVSSDNVYSTLAYDTVNDFGPGGLPGHAATGTYVDMILGGFAFALPAGADPITGIAVSITGKKAGTTAGLAVFPWSTNFGGAWGTGVKHVGIPFTTTNAAYAVGSSTDTWGITWSASDFASGTFFLVLRGSTPGNLGGTADQLFIDAVSVQLTYGKGQQVGTVDAYPMLVLKPAGETVEISRNSPPPRATTGDVFQGSLVLNDTTNERVVWFSYPDTLDYFPTEYFLPIDDRAAVRCIRTLGNIMIVGTDRNIYRLNYLPRDVDAEFDQGRVAEIAEPSMGIPGPHAARLFQAADSPLRCAFANRFGVFWTDGYRTHSLNSHVNYFALFDPTNMDKCILVNNPQTQELLLDYVALGSGTTARTKRLRFSYHQEHILDDGSLKCSGPCDISVYAGTVGARRTGEQPFYTGDGSGNVRCENQGAVNTMTVLTRPFYFAGVGSEIILRDVLIRYTLSSTAASSPMNITTTPLIDKVNTARRTGTAKAAAVLPFTSSAAYPQDEKEIKNCHLEGGEGVSLQITMDNATHVLGLSDLTMEWASAGRENAK